jgi:hypothetical protein
MSEKVTKNTQKMKNERNFPEKSPEKALKCTEKALKCRKSVKKRQNLKISNQNHDKNVKKVSKSDKKEQN